MSHVEMVHHAFRLVVVPLSPIEGYEVEFTGFICETCGASRVLLRWMVEFQPFLSNTHNNYLLVEKEVCMDCDNIPHVIMYESANQVRTLYGKAE